METLPALYTSLVQTLSCHRHWLDARHLKTLAWMVSGLIQAKTVSTATLHRIAKIADK
jgi:hypothetical protein